MTGWNLPSGCSVRDIPGNRPEDEAAEAQADFAYDWINQQNVLNGLDEDAKDQLCEALCQLIDKSRQEGYHDAQTDDTMGQEQCLEAFVQSFTNLRLRLELRLARRDSENENEKSVGWLAALNTESYRRFGC